MRGQLREGKQAGGAASGPTCLMPSSVLSAVPWKCLISLTTTLMFVCSRVASFIMREHLQRVQGGWGDE